MPRDRQVSCLQIGDADCEELRRPLEWLAERSQLSRSVSPAAALNDFAGCEWDLIVLVQSRPGQISGIDVESLSRACPSAKLVALLGSWCEGETRTGQPWPGVWRLLAHEFPLRMRTLLDLEKRSRAWSLPRQLSDAERLYYETAEPSSPVQGTILIAASNFAAYVSLSEAIRKLGLDSVRHLPGPLIPPPEFGSAIWDAKTGSEEEWRAIQDFARSVVPLPLLILLGFPRTGDFVRAKLLATALSASPGIAASAGIEVLAKPFRLGDLHAVLTRTMGRGRTPATTPPFRAAVTDSQVVTSAREYY